MVMPPGAEGATAAAVTGIMAGTVDGSFKQGKITVITSWSWSEPQQKHALNETYRKEIMESRFHFSLPRQLEYRTFPPALVLYSLLFFGPASL